MGVVGNVRDGGDQISRYGSLAAPWKNSTQKPAPLGSSCEWQSFKGLDVALALIERNVSRLQAEHEWRHYARHELRAQGPFPAGAFELTEVERLAPSGPPPRHWLTPRSPPATTTTGYPDRGWRNGLRPVDHFLRVRGEPRPWVIRRLSQVRSSRAGRTVGAGYVSRLRAPARESSGMG